MASAKAVPDNAGASQDKVSKAYGGLHDGAHSGMQNNRKQPVMAETSAFRRRRMSK